MEGKFRCWGRVLPSGPGNYPPLKLTCSPLKMDGWKMIHFLLGWMAYFEGRTVSFREGNISHHGKFGKSSTQVGAGCGKRICYASFQEGSG